MSMLLGKVGRVGVCCLKWGRVEERGEELEKKFVQLEIMMSNKEIEMNILFVYFFSFFFFDQRRYRSLVRESSIEMKFF